MMKSKRSIGQTFSNEHIPKPGRKPKGARPPPCVYHPQLVNDRGRQAWQWVSVSCMRKLARYEMNYATIDLSCESLRLGQTPEPPNFKKVSKKC
eukprot:981985-Amphidinium_carterae.1